MMGKGFGSQEVFHVPEEGKGYILDNTGGIGDHVCIWTMQTKSYNKLVSQFETRRGLGSFSGHMADNANCPQQASSYDIRVPQGVRTRLYQNRVFYVLCEGERLSTEMHNHNFSSRSIVIGCNTVEWVNTYKRFVVIISDDLRWVHHNEYISKKASKHLYSLRILERVGVASDSILRVCLTIFRPILEYGVIYCNEVNKRSLFIYLFI